MKNLAELQHRKAELKAKIELQREELKHTLLEIRQEIEPAKLLQNAFSGVLDLSPKRGEDSGRLPAPLTFLTDLLIRDPRLAMLVKYVAPLLLRFLPIGKKKAKKPEAELHEKPTRTLKGKMYGELRRGVASFRNALKKGEKPEPETTPPATVEQVEN